MSDRGLRIWQEALFEFHLTHEDTAKRVAAIHPAFVHGFEVDELVALTGFPAWRVQQAIFGK